MKIKGLEGDERELDLMDGDAGGRSCEQTRAGSWDFEDDSSCLAPKACSRFECASDCRPRGRQNNHRYQPRAEGAACCGRDGVPPNPDRSVFDLYDIFPAPFLRPPLAGVLF